MSRMFQGVRRSLWRVVVLASLGLPPAGRGLAGAANGPPGTQPPSTTRTIQAIAVGRDGVLTGLGLVADAGAHPTMAALAGDELLAIFEEPSNPTESIRLASSRSTDGGRTWSAPQPIEIAGEKSLEDRPRDPALAAAPGGSIRLYYVTGPADRAIIASAISTDGRRFDIEPGERFAIANASLLDPVVVAREGRVVLFVRRADQPGTLVRAESSDGLRFEQRGELAVARPSGQAARAAREPAATYVGLGGEVRGLARGAGGRWSLDAALAMREASSACGVRLRDGTAIVLACLSTGDVAGGLVLPRAPQSAGAATAQRRTLRGGSTGASGPASTDHPPVVADAAGDEHAPAMADERADAPTPHTPLIPPDRAQAGGGRLAIETEAADDIDLAAQWDEWPRQSTKVDAAADLPRNDIYVESGALPALTAALSRNADPVVDLGVPPPDFDEPVDYLACLTLDRAESGDDDAAPFYAEFLSRRNDDGSFDSAIPVFSSLLNDADSTRAMAPWEPGSFPHWEASYQESLAFVARFEQAVAHRDYVTPIRFESDIADQPLLGLMLPDLAPHRAMAKQIISNAWRVDDGGVSSGKLVDAWQTVTRGAQHFEQGITLIEQLVGVAEKNLVYSNVRTALAQGVVSPADLPRVRQVMAEAAPPADPARWMRGELAFSMDLVQYTAVAVDPNGRRAFDAERLGEIMTMGAGEEVPPEKMNGYLKADPVETVMAFRNYYAEYAAMARKGYPEIRAADLDQLGQRYAATNAVTNDLLPALGRVYALRHRHEASRRATDLAVALHEHRAATGQWPQRLADLPAEQIATARTDPFTGHDFSYRLTEDGPVVYSASENGTDDGGVHAPRWGDGQPGSPEDYVFWPPEGSSGR